MGLLDDAIREHLDLKRRHGADAGEVARQEREAFGQGPMPPAPAASEAGGPATAEHAPPAARDTLTDFDDEAPAAPARRPFDADVPGDDLPAASEALPGEPRSGAVSSDRYTPAPADDDIDWSDPAPADPGPSSSTAEPDRDEDVLEETPEFLQETPEHDRLWFEQRPPKDFDF